MKYNKDNKKTKLGIRTLTYCTLISASLLSANQVHAATDSSASTNESTEYQSEGASTSQTQEPSQTTNNEETPDISAPEISSNNNIVRASNESIDDWMPDKNLQKAVAAQYGITVNELTKDYINSHLDQYVSLELTDDEDKANTDSSYYYVRTLKGLEFIPELQCYIRLYHTTNQALSVDLSYFLTIKNDSTKHHRFDIDNENADFTNYHLFWDYLNCSSQSEAQRSSSSVSLNDGGITRTPSVSLEKAINDYQKLVLPISSFYDKGTDYALEPGYNVATLIFIPDRRPSDDDLDFDTTDEDNSANFLTYTFFNDGHNDLIYAVYLEDDNLVFKLKKGSIANSDGPVNLTSKFSFSHETIPLFSSFLNGSYSFRTEVSLNVALSSAINSNGTVKVNYEDENGTPIAASETLTGAVGASYTSVQKTIPGYTFRNLKAGSASASGVYTTSDQVVTYVYTRNFIPNPTSSSKLTVHYQDTDGNKIADSKTIFGNVGDSYDVSENAGYKLNIEGYTFKEIKGSPTGTLTDTEQTVIYVYTKDQTDKPEIEITIINKNDKHKKNEKEVNKKYINNTKQSTPTQKNSLPKTGKTSGIAQVLAGIAVLFTTFGAWVFKRKQ